MSYISNQLLALTKQLAPSGRAFRIAIGSYFEKLFIGLALSEERAYNDATSILNSLIPDNSFFTTQDADDWERRLGLITNEATPLSDRMLAIQRKMNYPGTISARAHYLYIQQQLQAAGFNVYVYENIFPDGMGNNLAKTFQQFTGSSPLAFIQLNDEELNDFQLGDTFQQSGHYIVANYIDESLDQPFIIFPNYRCAFFIGGPTPGSFANIPVSRHDEFRQLILKLKQTQDIALLCIFYIY